ncbi:signal peptide containing protein [Theileria equi strain WA]|uniref:Signal peptide containing protein n=1 Tax=Theileria equi strain WA TaxID=1537102 RepID=L1LAU0_THEEQ|nr:signal peptide containing protein [Theileria equi strain WA]EKX72400.1 signal peptide containing protein [Theileria equi strain WA]|eukprot:XP_004831852.1 signal peptide containing protein [Theileria equi strain WA]
MRILAVLLTVCLVGLCHCGGDDGKGALKGSVGGQQPTPQKLPQVNAQPAAKPNQKATKSAPQQAAKPVTPVTQSAGQGGVTLAHPDESKVSISEQYSSGVKTKRYTPKRGFNVTSVTHNGEELWKKDEDYKKFISAEVSSKGDSSVLLISTNTGIKHFKKDGSSWTSSNEKEYEEKLREMRYTD